MAEVVKVSKSAQKKSILNWFLSCAAPASVASPWLMPAERASSSSFNKESSGSTFPEKLHFFSLFSNNNCGIRIHLRTSFLALADDLARVILIGRLGLAKLDTQTQLVQLILCLGIA